ncbi:hypothetical protein [Cyclobacterium xiamenense]|uniref:hypothetical protein n=1 Tax=Cyclobacterium xiamenense TaxID=1297121 RepID=UPI000B898C36|nr:hypothetical protein [Cyclobacterium xiamenense]
MTAKSEGEKTERKNKWFAYFGRCFHGFRRNVVTAFFQFCSLYCRIGRGSLSPFWYNFREFMGEKKGLALIYEEIAAFALPQGMLFPAQNESVCVKTLFFKKTVVNGLF